MKTAGLIFIKIFKSQMLFILLIQLLITSIVCAKMDVYKKSQTEPRRPNLIFNSTAWLEYPAMVNKSTDAFQFILRFQTFAPNGTLFVGDSESNKFESTLLHLFLRNGSLHLSAWSPKTFAFGVFERQYSCQSPFDSCADGRWHDLSIAASFNMLQTQLDGSVRSERLPKAFHGLRVKTWFVGGLPSRLTELKRFTDVYNFSGCIQNAFYKDGSTPVDLVHLVRQKASGDRNSGSIAASSLRVNRVELGECRSERIQHEALSRNNAEKIVTFARTGGFLLLRGWKSVSEGRMSFQLQTHRRNCLVLFASSGWPLQSQMKDFTEKKRRAGALGQLIPVVNETERMTGTDVFCVELREGYLVLLLNTGSGVSEFQTEPIWSSSGSGLFVADGKMHAIDIHLKEGTLAVSIDKTTRDMRPNRKPKYTYLNLNGDLYIGGLPEELRLSSSQTPPQAWSARLRQDFVGCFGHLVIDGRPVDLDLEATASWARNRVETGGCISHSKCASSGYPSDCSDLWQETDCELFSSNSASSRCQQGVKILAFNGFQGIGVRLSRLPEQSEAESLVLRFQTLQTNFFLFESASVISTAPDKFALQIVDSRIVLFYNLGFDTKNYSTTTIVSDGTWHTLRVLRRARRLEIRIDNSSFLHSLKDEASMLDSDFICVGNLDQSPDMSRTNPIYQTIESLPYKGPEAFVGRLSQFYFNGLDILHLVTGLSEYLDSGEDYALNVGTPAALFGAWKENIEVSATEDIMSDLLEFPLQFRNGGGLLEYPLDTHLPCLKISFSLRTGEISAIIFILESTNGNFLGLEMVNGFLYIRFHLDIVRGQSALQMLGQLNDTQWHSLTFIVCIQSTLSLKISVDGKLHEPKCSGMILGRMTPFHRLLLGGLSDSESVNRNGQRLSFVAPVGYHGCIAAFEVSQEASQLQLESSADLQGMRAGNKTKRKIPTNPLRIMKQLRQVDMGCQLKSNAWDDTSDTICRAGVCGFGGRCVQQLKTFFCDCTMSGFTGSVCTDVPTALKFTATTPGCAVLEFSPMRNTSRDALAFGVQTKHRKPVVLLHIASHANSLDFLRLELAYHRKRFILRLTYNMGAGHQVLQGPDVDVADGNYHVIRIIRTKTEVKLQINSEDVLETTTANNNGSHFNEIQRIFVGCDLDSFVERSLKGDTAKISEAEITATASSVISPFDGHIVGLNLNGISLNDILLGKSVSGIYVKYTQSLSVDPSFTPKLRQASHLPANDMEADQSITPRALNVKSNPLVVAKPTCFEPEAYRKFANCKPSNPHGIVQPHWTLPPLTAKDPVAKWNKDQYSGPYNQAPGSKDSTNIQNPSSKDTFQEHQQQQQQSHFVASKGLHDIESSVFPSIDVWDKAPHDDTRLLGPMIVRETPTDIQTDDGLREVPGASSSAFIFQTFNFWVILGVSAVVLAILIFTTYAVFRCRQRNEGSYNVEENRACIDRRPLSNSPLSNSKGRPRRSKPKNGFIGAPSANSSETFEMQPKAPQPIGDTDTALTSIADSSPRLIPASRKQPQSPNKEWYV